MLIDILLLSLKDENKVKKIKFSTIRKNRIKNKTLPKKHDVADVSYRAFYAKVSLPIFIPNNRKKMSSDVKLCKWKKQDYKDNLGELKKIVKKPKFVCEKCGRAAKSKKWLCEPVSLEKEK